MEIIIGTPLKSKNWRHKKLTKGTIYTITRLFDDPPFSGVVVLGDNFKELMFDYLSLDKYFEIPKN